MKDEKGSRYAGLVEKYASHAHPTSFGWKWSDHRFNRVAVINGLVARTGGRQCSYLEIDHNRNTAFDAICAAHKIGVDPVNGGTHRMTFDAFFAKNTDTFDVIFVDDLRK